MEFKEVCQKIALYDLKRDLSFIENENKYSGLIMCMLKKTKKIHEENKFFNCFMTFLYIVSLMLLTLYVETYSFGYLISIVVLIGIALGNVCIFYINKAKIKVYSEIIDVCEFNTKNSNL